jgi:metal-responsive CopG/Arc/MetJ family transcriptional regulator
MKTCKIAITIPENLLKTVDQLSDQLKISRSKILSEGALYIVKKLARKKIVNSYNKVFSDKKVQKEQIQMAENFLQISNILDDEY